MAERPPVCDVGWKAPGFSLIGVDGETYTLDQLKGPKGTLVAFICNHCPYVVAVIDRIVRDAKELAAHGVNTVAICANDATTHPDDSFENMKVFAARHGFTFPYLHDESQDVALAYNAICTPDFFLYGPDRALFYTGQFCSSRPKLPHPPVPGAPPQRTDVPVTGEDMRAAVDALLAGQAAPEHQVPSAGCSIKWLPGKNPSWG